MSRPSPARNFCFRERRAIVTLALTLVCLGPLLVRADEPGPADEIEVPSAVVTSPEEEAGTQEGKTSLMTLLPELTPVSDYRGDIRERSSLFGDLGGKRQKLYEKGVAIDLSLTQVPQGVVSGGRSTEWEYGGNSDYYLALDSGRLGLWPGGLFAVHGRTKFGRSVLPQSGTLSPVNYNWLTPSVGEETESFLEEYYVLQGLSDRVLFGAGRVLFGNIGDTNRFAGNAETQFLNTALKNSPLLGVLTSALSAHGTFLMIEATPNVTIAPFALSRNDVDGVYGSPGGLFSEYSTGAQLVINWDLGELPGEFLPLAGYSSKDVVALDNPLLPGFIFGLPIPKKSGNWVAGFSASQYFYVPKGACDPDYRRPKVRTAPFDLQPEGIGVFLRFHYAPEDRNPYNIFVSGGLGGRGVIPTRELDRYGLGFYALMESGDLKNQPLLGGALETEWGMEVFYNVAITPWLQFSPSLQYIQSGLPRVDDSTVVATRIQTYF